MAGSTSAIRRSAASIISSGVTSPRLRQATASIAVIRMSASDAWVMLGPVRLPAPAAAGSLFVPIACTNRGPIGNRNLVPCRHQLLPTGRVLPHHASECSVARHDGIGTRRPRVRQRSFLAGARPQPVGWGERLCLISGRAAQGSRMCNGRDGVCSTSARADGRPRRLPERVDAAMSCAPARCVPLQAGGARDRPIWSLTSNEHARKGGC